MVYLAKRYFILYNYYMNNYVMLGRKSLMNTILIIGNFDFFTKTLIKKLYIEKWRIYTLVSSKKLIKPAHVFEQYVFDYSSNSVKEIIKSCRPDVIVFTGAYDSLYNWDSENDKDTSLKFTADLSNILISATILGIRHFIYISSEVVFEDDYIIDIREDVAVSPNSYKGMTISQGENLAFHYGQTNQMEVTVLRLANMYGIPYNLREVNDVCSRMCVEAMEKGRLVVNAKKIFSCLYVKDGVEALYILINAPERKHSIYHVSGTEELTEDSIARLIKENSSHPIDIIDKTMGLKQRKVLSNERFTSEFTFDVRNSYRQIVPMIISYINNHKRRFLRSSGDDDIKSNRYHLLRLLKKAIPFIECSVLFIPVFLLSHGVIDVQYLDGINFYLLYVLLFALVYGRQIAIFASLFCVIGYSLSYILGSSSSSLVIDAKVYIQIVQIFIVGLSVGHLKDRFIDTSADMNDEVNYIKDQLKDIMLINSSNERIKEYYTDKLVGSTESIGRIYNITSKLQRAEKGEVLFAALDTLKEIMGTEDVSIYLVSNRNYCRLTSASSVKASSLGKSITMDKYHMIFDVLQSNQVYINRSLDINLPMMASAIFDDTENMRIVILIWNLPYERMTLYYSNLLTIAGALVYSVFVRDANYIDALAYRRYIPKTKVLQEDAFKEMVELYRRAGKKGYAEASLLYIQNEDMSITDISDLIHPLLRETDYIGLLEDGGLSVLLTNSNMKESAYVRERLEGVGIKTTYLSHITAQAIDTNIYEVD